MTKRNPLLAILSLMITFVGCVNAQKNKTMKQDAIYNIKPLGFMWEVSNPFLFCAHHDDKYPVGNAAMAPDPSLLKGRNIGQDFEVKDGWRMYHGSTIPGFPAHPHRGFETVTIVVEGFVDHSDSWGQAGRYGMGDVQWMTAGSGLQHSEMFPLLNDKGANPLELFQVWINLPKAKKFASPYFKMLWNEKIPVYKSVDENGKSVEVNVIAGSIGTVKALEAAPDSWAAQPENQVAIWTIKLEADAEWTLPATEQPTKRTLYFHKGNSVTIEGKTIAAQHSFEVKADEELTLVNGNEDAYFLLLQGNPINEPVAQYGPFVMNTQDEIRQAMKDYQATEFGGWPWSRQDMVQPREQGRFAKYKDGTIEKP